MLASVPWTPGRRIFVSWLTSLGGLAAWLEQQGQSSPPGPSLSFLLIVLTQLARILSSTGKFIEPFPFAAGAARNAAVERKKRAAHFISMVTLQN